MEHVSSEAELSLSSLVQSQRLAVLATLRAGRPYTSLVAFVATPDLRHLIFATNRDSRKYVNLLADGRVAVHIDSRANLPSDFELAVSVTATGRAAEMAEDERWAAVPHYLVKHPQLQEFIATPDCAFFRVTVEVYYLVRQFQNVVEMPVGRDPDEDRT